MWAFRFVIVMLMLGLPVALALAWVSRPTRERNNTPSAALDGKKPPRQFKRSWLSLGISSNTLSRFGIPERAFRFVLLALILGFPVAIIITWTFDLMADKNSPRRTPNRGPKRRNGS